MANLSEPSKPKQTPPSPISLAKKATWSLILAVSGITFLPTQTNIALGAYLLLAVTGAFFYFSSKTRLGTGIRRSDWSEEELDEASDWVPQRKWEYIGLAGCVSWLIYCLWAMSKNISPYPIGIAFPGLNLAIVGLDKLRKMLAPPDPDAKNPPRGDIPLRTLVFFERAAGITYPRLPSASPPPRPRKKFELYQYPVRRTWPAPPVKTQKVSQDL